MDGLSETALQQAWASPLFYRTGRCFSMMGVAAPGACCFSSGRIEADAPEQASEQAALIRESRGARLMGPDRRGHVGRGARGAAALPAAGPWGHPPPPA